MISIKAYRQGLEAPTFIGTIDDYKANLPSFGDTSKVQNIILKEIVRLAKDPDNLEAQRLRFRMINFMEGLLFFDDGRALKETKERIKNAGLSTGGERYKRYKTALTQFVDEAYSKGKAEGKDTETIFEDLYDAYFNE